MIDCSLSARETFDAGRQPSAASETPHGGSAAAARAYGVQVSGGGLSGGGGGLSGGGLAAMISPGCAATPGSLLPCCDGSAA